MRKRELDDFSGGMMRDCCSAAQSSIGINCGIKMRQQGFRLSL